MIGAGMTLTRHDHNGAEVIELSSVPGFVVFDLPGAPESAGGTRLAPDVSLAEVALLARARHRGAARLRVQRGRGRAVPAQLVGGAARSAVCARELNEKPRRGVRTGMQTWDAITSRRNVRSYADRPIPAAELDRVLEAGRRAPSSQNWQPWDFIVVTDRDQLRELTRVWRGAGHVGGSAATIVVIGPAADNEFYRAQLDLGQATMAMLLAAADLGIGSCHAGVADLPLAREILGFPEDRDWALLISLGYPADRPLVPVRNPRRRPFTEVVHRGRW
jgi:nitroreductase